MIEIVPSTALHARELAYSLREKDRQEALGLGLDPVKGLFKAYRGACYRKTVLVHDEPAAMFGLHGNLLGTIGRPFLITGELVYQIPPIRFVKIYREEAQRMAEMFPRLENLVDSDYHEAVRLLEMSGFTVQKEKTEVMPGKFYQLFYRESE